MSHRHEASAAELNRIAKDIGDAGWHHDSAVLRIIAASIDDRHLVLELANLELRLEKIIMGRTADTVTRLEGEKAALTAQLAESKAAADTAQSALADAQAALGVAQSRALDDADIAALDAADKDTLPAG